MSDSMNIAVLGAGNSGTLIAAKLATNGATELFIHGRGEHAANLAINGITIVGIENFTCLLYTSPSPRDVLRSRMPSSA